MTIKTINDDEGEYEIVVVDTNPQPWPPASELEWVGVPEEVWVRYAWERHHFSVELPRAVHENRN